MAIKYRPEIDGLRTIAVGSVLIYHLKIAIGGGAYLLGGGFLGVDIFFVISGFLITSILVREIEQDGRISIARFYERRARRILPALFVVLILTLVAGAFLMLPSELIELAWSSMAALFFVSNIYWFFELSTYGANGAMYQPLLHTWTLGVEEQFYIFFPLILVLVCKWMRSGLTALIGTLMVLGFVFCQMVTHLFPSLSFYWLPSRGWELLAGSWLAALSLSHPHALRGGWANRVMPSVGLALILVPILFSHLDVRFHPGILTLPVILGTCAIIWWSDRTEPVGRLLSSRPFVAVGLISYSLYLWHYPIYAFGRMISPVPGVLDYLAWIALSFAGAIFSYYLIESPFRQKGRFGIAGLVKGFSAAAVLLCVVVLAVWAGNGWKQRFPELIALYGDSEMDNGFARDASWGVLGSLSPNQTIGTWNARDPSEHELTDNWFANAGDRRKYLIVGNSHGKDTFNALYLNREMFPDSAFARFALTRRFQDKEIEALRASPNYAAADEIVISTRFGEERIPELRKFIREVKADGKAVTLMGPAVEFETVGRLPLFDWYLRTHSDDFDRAELDRIGWEKRRDPPAAFMRELVQLADEEGVPLLRKELFNCDTSARECAIATDDGLKAFFDYGHYTLDGARYFGRRMHDLGWFQSSPPKPSS